MDLPPPKGLTESGRGMTITSLKQIDLEKADFKIILVDNMEGFVAPTSSPCVVDLHEEVFDFSCFLDDTEKVVDTILSMTPPSQLNTAYKSVKMHLKVARELGVGADLISGAAQVTVPNVVPPIPLPLSQPKSTKRKPTATVSKPPQTQTQIESEPPTKETKLTGKAIPCAEPPQGAPGSEGLEEGEIPADTQQPLEEGAVGGTAADSTDKPGMFLPIYCN